MSINLTGTNQSLELVLSTSTGADCVVSGRDNLTGALTPMSQDTTVAATTSTIATAPAASHQVMVDDVQIAITAANPVSVKVQKNTGGTLRQLYPSTVFNPGERLHYTDDMGWRAFTASGIERFLNVGYSLLKAPFFDGTAGGPKTYTSSVGCTAILIEFWAAGGGGGGAAALAGAFGSGGCCGGFVRKFIIGPPASFTYTLGAGGTGVSGAAGNAGSASTTSSINGITLVPTAGPGGLTVAGGSTVTDSGSPTAVSGTGGDENLIQPSGAAGCRFSATQGFGGEGGDSCMGNNGARSSKQATGNSANGNNAGGGGAFTNTAAALAGGLGAPACIRIWEFAG